MRFIDIVIQITDKCNLQCNMCEIPREGKSGHLSLEQIKNLIDTSSHQAKSIAITGGEPLLHPHIFEIISYASSKGFEVYMPSNGVLISETIAARLKESGINTVNISIEGPEDVHDSLRGKGNFSKAISGLKRLRHKDIECTLAMTVMSVNFKNMGYLIEMARAYGVTTVKYQPFNNDFVSDKKKILQYHLRTEQLGELKKEIDYVIFLADKYKIQTNPKSYLLRLPEYFSKKGRIDVKTCAVPAMTMSVDKDGKVFPCWPMAKYGDIGDIGKEPFDVIWKSEKAIKSRQLAKKGECPGCLMSCHDKNVSSMGTIKLSLYKDRLVSHLSKLKRNLIWKIRGNRIQKKPAVNNPEIEETLKDISEVKNLLKSRIRQVKKST